MSYKLVYNPIAKKFDYVVMDETELANRLAEIQRSVSITVAPSDALQIVKDTADYVCDGTADNVEIQAAITAAGDNSTVLLFGGNYYIDTNISIQNDYFSLVGEGKSRDQVVIHATDGFTQVAGPFKILLELGNPGGFPAEVNISNITLECNKDNIGDTIRGAVWGNAAVKPVFDNIKIINADEAIKSFGNCHDATVKNSTFISCTDAINIDSNRAIIKDNYFEDCVQGVVAGSSDYSTVTDNKFKNVQKAIYCNGTSPRILRNWYIAYTIVSSDSYFIKTNCWFPLILENQCFSSTHTAIILADSGKGYGTITNNAIFDTNTNIEADGYAIDVQLGAGYLIENNTIRDSYGNMVAGVHIESSRTEVQVYNNTIVGYSSADIVDDSGVSHIIRRADAGIRLGGEFGIKTYTQNSEPTVSEDDKMVIWRDNSGGTDLIYLVYRRATGDQVKVQLT